MIYPFTRNSNYKNNMIEPINILPKMFHNHAQVLTQHILILDIPYLLYQ